METDFLPIETERLVLRRFVADDLDALHAYVSQDEVARYQLWEPLDRTGAVERLRNWVGMENIGTEDTSLPLAITLKEGGCLVGDCGLMFRDAEARQGEVGFTLHPAHQGQGYATEALVTLFDIGFARYKLHRIFGRCDARNEGSWQLMERLGMRREAHFREHALFKGGWDYEYYYAILEDEWRARRREEA